VKIKDWGKREPALEVVEKQGPTSYRTKGTNRAIVKKVGSEKKNNKVVDWEQVALAKKKGDWFKANTLQGNHKYRGYR